MICKILSNIRWAEFPMQLIYGEGHFCTKYDIIQALENTPNHLNRVIISDDHKSFVFNS